MGWIVPTGRDEHPCIMPGDDEARLHRAGEFWRCEVCDDLWVLQLRRALGPQTWRRVTSWWVRWRYRNKGWTQPGEDNHAAAAKP